MLNDLLGVRMKPQGYSRKQTSRRPLLMLTGAVRMLNTAAHSEAQLVMQAYRGFSCVTIHTSQEFQRGDSKM